MSNDIQIGSKVFIRNLGKDEAWLQNIIYSNPEKLGLGQLIPVRKEKKQVSGGRLDILLKDPEDNSMYEVEVMLGKTDPSHIIRSIEYWDNEKRRYPQRQHFCVLIAESFDRRYFNVIQLLSQNIPMIAIQVDIIETNGQHVLHFSKILDIYVEPEEEIDETKASEKTWREKAEWTLVTAKYFQNQLSEYTKGLYINFTQSYISIMRNGRIAYTFDKRTKPNSILWFRVKEEEKEQAIKKLLNENKIEFNFYNKDKSFSFIVTKSFFAENKEVIEKLHNLYTKEYGDEE